MPFLSLRCLLHAPPISCAWINNKYLLKSTNCGTSLATCGGVLRRMDAERVASSFALITFAAVAKLLLLCAVQQFQCRRFCGKKESVFVVM